MRKTGTVRALFIAGLLLVTALTPYVRAQTSLVGAALDGTINDSAGARMPQVIVTVRNIGTRQARQVSTNSEGAYHVAELGLARTRFRLHSPVSPDTGTPGWFSPSGPPHTSISCYSLRP